MNSFYLQPLMTEKSLAFANDAKYQFIAPIYATKGQIARHVADHWSVTVVSVHTARMPSVNVMFKRRPGQQSMWKKATVRLKPGETIAEFSLPADATTAPEPVDKNESTPESTESQITVRSKSKKEAAK